MVYFLLISTALFWGGTFVAGKLLAGVVPPLTSSFLRFFIACIALAIILTYKKTLPSMPAQKHWPRLLLLGFTGIFSYNILFFTGLEQISAGKAALIIAITPLIIAMASSCIHREMVTYVQVAGILLSLVGALFVISDGNLSSLIYGGFGYGELAILGCVLSWSAYTLFSRSVLADLSPLTAVFYSIVVGALMLLPLALFEGMLSVLPRIPLSGWLSLLYLGILGTAIGFTWYYRGIDTIGASRAGIFINLVPVFGLLLSWLVLSETFRPSVIVGGFLVVAGIKLTNHVGSRNTKRSENTPF